MDIVNEIAEFKELKRYEDYITSLHKHIEELQSHGDKLGEIITSQTKKRLELEEHIKELEGVEQERERLSKLLIEARIRIVELEEEIEKVDKRPMSSVYEE